HRHRASRWRDPDRPRGRAAAAPLPARPRRGCTRRRPEWRRRQGAHRCRGGMRGRRLVRARIATGFTSKKGYPVEPHRMERLNGAEAGINPPRRPVNGGFSNDRRGHPTEKAASRGAGRELLVGLDDKIRNKVQEIKGRTKKNAGRATDDQWLEA